MTFAMVPNHRPTLTVHNPVLLFFAALSATVHPPTSILESERDGCGDHLRPICSPSDVGDAFSLQSRPWSSQDSKL
jgi:hypothetical protein